MKTLILMIVALMAFPGTYAAYTMTEVTSEKSPVIIFIPGLYGSSLRNAITKKRVFVTAREAFFGREALSLHQKDLMTPAGPELEVDGVLDSVAGVDVYKGFLNSLSKANGGMRVIPFAYDWRQDLSLTVGKLDVLVKQLKQDGAGEVILVGHSMGGLIATYYLAYGDQDVSTAKLNWAGAREVQKVVILGTPYRGSFLVFHDMMEGSALPLMGRMLPADAASSFPSIYAALPFANGRLLDARGTATPLKLSELNSWEQGHYGILRRTDLPSSVMDARNLFLSEVLSRGLQFQKLLNMEDGSGIPAGLRLLNIVGTGTETPDGVFSANGKLVFDAHQASRMGLPGSLLNNDGDGTVTVFSSAIPAGLVSVTESMSSSYTHQNLFRDKNVVSKIIEFIKD